MTKLPRNESPLPKGVEHEFHKTQLSDSHTSPKALNEFLSVLLTFVCLGEMWHKSSAYNSVCVS